MAEIEIHFPDGLVGYQTLKEDKPLVVGAASSCDVPINVAGCLRKHFMIRRSSSADGWRFDCNKDAEGVQVNGATSKGARLSPDDEITFGDYAFILRDSSAPAAPIRAQVVAEPIEHAAAAPMFDEGDYYTPMWKSRTFLTIAGGLAFLLASGMVVYWGYHYTRANKIYAEAIGDYEKRLTEKAGGGFELFRTDYPDDKREGKARIYVGLAKVLGLIDNGSQWEPALIQTEETVAEAEKLPAFREPEMTQAVAVALLEIAKGTAEKARDTRSRIDDAAYRQSQAALKLADRVAGREGELTAKFDEIVKLQDAAERAMKKERERQAVVVQMSEAIKAKQPMAVYSLHRKLYAQYPDLRKDSESLVRRDEAQKLEKTLTVFQPSSENAPAKPPARPAAAARPPVRRTVLGDAKANNRIAGVLAADTLFGVDSGSGEVKWQIPVGFDPAFSPMPVEGGGLLIHRPQDNALALLDAATGSERWRASVAPGAIRYLSRPTIAQGKLYVVGLDPKTPALGRLFVYVLDTGRFAGQFIFPQPLSGVPVYDPARKQILLPGEQVSVYSVNPSSNVCTLVQPLDHEPGVLRWAPALAGRFLFTIENLGGEKSILHCFVLSGEDGVLREKPIGDLGKLPGVVRRDPVLKGTRLFVTTDQDAFQVFDLGGEEDEKPLQLAARSVPIGAGAVKVNRDAPYALPAGERELWTIGQRIRFYQLRNGETEPLVKWQKILVGVPSQPPLLLEDALIVVSRTQEGGAVTALGIDARNQKESWQLALAQTPKAVQRDPSDPKSFLLTPADGPAVRLALADLSSGKVVELPPRAVELTGEPEPLFRDVPGWPTGAVQWSGVGGNQVRMLLPGKPEHRFTLSAPASAPPTVSGKGILFPCRDGLLYWIDPTTGADLADPFGVAYVEGRPVELGAVASLNETTVALVAGLSLLRLQLQKASFPFFAETARIDLPEASDAVALDPALIHERIAATQAVAVGDRLLLATGRKLHRLRIDDLSIEQSWPLAGESRVTPTLAGGRALFSTDRRELLCLGEPGIGKPAEILWRQTLDRSPLGPPQSSGADGFWLAYADGEIVERAAADGNVKREWNAGRALLDGPWMIGEQMVVLTPAGGPAALSAAR